MAQNTRYLFKGGGTADLRIAATHDEASSVGIVRSLNSPQSLSTASRSSGYGYAFASRTQPDYQY